MSDLKKIMNFDEIRYKCDEVIRFYKGDKDFTFKVGVNNRDKILIYIESPVSTVVDGFLNDIIFANSYRDLVKFCNYSVDRVNITESILEEL